MARITGAPEPHFVKRPPSPKDLRTKLSLCIPNGTRLSTSKLIVLVVIIMTIVGLRVLSTVYIFRDIKPPYFFPAPFFSAGLKSREIADICRLVKINWYFDFTNKICSRVNYLRILVV